MAQRIPSRQDRPILAKGQNPRTAVAYVRVSSEEQAREGVSLPAQEERIRAYCVASELDLIGIVSDDGISASKPLAERDGGMELVKVVARGEAKHVVALKLDRLFRDAVDALNQTRAWDKAGVAFHLVDLGGNAVNTRTAAGRMFLTVLAAFAELERNLVGERTAIALAHMKGQRQAYGPVPFGYDRRGKRLQTNEVEQAVVKQIRRLRNNGWSYGRIAQRLNAKGVTGKRGGSWHAAGVRYVLGNDLYNDPRRGISLVLGQLRGPATTSTP